MDWVRWLISFLLLDALAVLFGLGGFLFGRLTGRPEVVPFFGNLLMAAIGCFGVLLGAGLLYGLYETLRWAWRWFTARGKPEAVRTGAPAQTEQAEELA